LREKSFAEVEGSNCVRRSIGSRPMHVTGMLVSRLNL
jgi:hypothetical protein